MKSSNQKIEKRNRRRIRIRAKISGTEERPRLAVFKSNTALYAQLINDDKGATLLSVNSNELKGKTAGAVELGKLVAKKALEKNVKAVVFDRGGFVYRGNIKAFAEGAREGGLQF
jgi:large subunit ribosomal protein L18